MKSLTLKQAQSLIGMPLNAWGDTVSKEDVSDMEKLKNFIIMHLADSNGAYIKGDVVFYGTNR